jgi:hypothetical protein
MDRTEYEQLRVALAKHYDAAHAHTASKAEFYLAKLIDKPNARFSNCTQEEFLHAVRAALHSDKWKELGDLMGRWW